MKIEHYDAHEQFWKAFYKENSGVRKETLDAIVKKIQDFIMEEHTVKKIFAKYDKYNWPVVLIEDHGRRFAQYINIYNGDAHLSPAFEVPEELRHLYEA